MREGDFGNTEFQVITFRSTSSWRTDYPFKYTQFLCVNISCIFS